MLTIDGIPYYLKGSCISSVGALNSLKSLLLKKKPVRQEQILYCYLRDREACGIAWSVGKIAEPIPLNLVPFTLNNLPFKSCQFLVRPVDQDKDD